MAGAAPQKPETFMLSSEAQKALPQDAQVALQQVDNCKLALYIKIYAACLSPVANTLASEVFSHFSSRRLVARSLYPEIFATNGRIRILCIME